MHTGVIEQRPTVPLPLRRASPWGDDLGYGTISLPDPVTSVEFCLGVVAGDVRPSPNSTSCARTRSRWGERLSLGWVPHPSPCSRSAPVARYVVDVMPKPEILDPQGKAVLGSLPRLGFAGVSDVRQGKRFEIELDGEPSDALLEEVRAMAGTLLSNPVIEDFEVHASGEEA